MPDLFTTVADLIEQVADVPAEQLSPDVRFATLTNWTSLEALGGCSPRWRTSSVSGWTCGRTWR